MVSNDDAIDFVKSQFSANSTFDVYISKGTNQIPDPSNFDLLIKKENSLSLSQGAFDMTQGFIAAIYIKMANDSLPVQLTVTPRFCPEFLQFSASASAAPPAAPATARPIFENPLPEPVSSEDAPCLFVNNLEYMLLGTFLGCIGTLIYYNGARFHQRFIESRGRLIPDPKQDPNQYIPRSPQQVLFDCDEEKDDLVQIRRK